MLALGDGENKILVLRQEAGLREIFQLHSYLQVKFSKIEVYVEINTPIGFVMDYLKWHYYFLDPISIYLSFLLISLWNRELPGWVRLWGRKLLQEIYQRDLWIRRDIH